MRCKLCIDHLCAASRYQLNRVHDICRFCICVCCRLHVHMRVSAFVYDAACSIARGSIGARGAPRSRHRRAAGASGLASGGVSQAAREQGLICFLQHYLSNTAN